MDVINRKVILIAVLFVLAVSVCARIGFYFQLPNESGLPVTDARVEIELKKYDGLQADFNLVAAKKIWGITVPSSGQNAGQEGAEDQRWQLLGILKEAEPFALIWRSQEGRVVRLSVGQEIIPGLTLSAVGNTGISYRSGDTEVMLSLYQLNTPDNQ